MLRFEISDIGQEEWYRHVAPSPALSLMQCWEYGTAKAETGPWRVERGLFLEDGRVVGAAQVLIRRLPGGVPGGLAWLNRGPLDLRGKGGGTAATLSMMAELAEYYGGRRGLYLRIAPPVPAGELSGAALRNAGLVETGTAGWASAFLDLAPAPEALRAGLGRKWRNHLNKAERLGLEVEEGEDGAAFATFLESHRRFTLSRGFSTSLTPELLNALHRLLPDGRRFRVLVARRSSEVVGGVLMARYGETCEYLAGNTSEEGRRMDAGQLLVWRAMLTMRDMGCRRLDLGGMDPELTPEGIYKFKEGIGGIPYRLAAEVEAAKGLLSRLVRWRVRRARPET